MSPRDRAVDLLIHYLITAFRGSGISWGPDNDAEVADIVDAIIAASKAVRS